MTDPDEEEWDTDAVVVDGYVEYVGLLVRPNLLAEVLDCLIEDTDGERATTVVRDTVERHGLNIYRDSLDERLSPTIPPYSLGACAHLLR